VHSSLGLFNVIFEQVLVYNQIILWLLHTVLN
jgi:hypothetical protein